jgi:hypothetical protein
MASGAARDDPVMVHAGVGSEGDCTPMACLARRNPSRDMIGRPARRHRSIMAGGTRAGRSLQTAIDVAAYAFHEGMRARQRETGLEVIEIGRALLRKRGPSK